MIRSSQFATAVFFLALAAPSTAREAHAQEREDTSGVEILAQVEDSETGAPVHYALVQILGLNLYAISDQGGIVRFPSLPLGNHSIMVSKLGYEVTVGNLLVEQRGFFRVGLVPTDDEVTASSGTLGGGISDRDTGRGISGVEVSLPNLGHSQITGATGSFQFQDVPPGPHVLMAAHLGYATREDTVYLPMGHSLHVDLEMGMEPIPLEGITVSVRSRMLEREGFYRRMNSGLSGRQWTRADIEEYDPIYLRDLLERAPGVMTRLRGASTVVMSMRRGRYCPLGVYVDGMEMPGFDLDRITPDHVEALEVYQGQANVPIEYALRHPCGVVLIWLRQGGGRE